MKARCEIILPKEWVQGMSVAGTLDFGLWTLDFSRSNHKRRACPNHQKHTPYGLSAA